LRVVYKAESVEDLILVTEVEVHRVSKALRFSLIAGEAWRLDESDPLTGAG